MVKKISLIILSLAIVATGITGFTKLNYWQRSVSIFKVNSSEQQFGRGGRGPGMEGMRRGEEMRRDGQGRGSIGEGGFEGGMRRGGGPGRGDHGGGKKINLATAGWYLAVFASFVVIVVYFERSIKLIRKKKNTW